MDLNELFEIFQKLTPKQRTLLVSLLEILRRSQDKKLSEDQLTPLIKGLFAGPAPSPVLSSKCPVCGK